VVVEEVAEVVKFEAMNLIDNLLLTNSPEKMQALHRVQQHKHVVFQDQPIIIEFERYRVQPPS